MHVVAAQLRADDVDQEFSLRNILTDIVLLWRRMASKMEEEAGSTEVSKHDQRSDQ